MLELFRLNSTESFSLTLSGTHYKLLEDDLFCRLKFATSLTSDPTTQLPPYHWIFPDS